MQLPNHNCSFAILLFNCSYILQEKALIPQTFIPYSFTFVTMNVKTCEKTLSMQKKKKALLTGNDKSTKASLLPRGTTVYNATVNPPYSVIWFSAICLCYQISLFLSLLQNKHEIKARCIVKSVKFAHLSVAWIWENSADAKHRIILMRAAFTSGLSALTKMNDIILSKC